MKIIFLSISLTDPEYNLCMLKRRKNETEYGIGLLLMLLVFSAVSVIVILTENPIEGQRSEKQACEVFLQELFCTEEVCDYPVQMETENGTERELTCHLLTNPTEYEILCRIVQAEAGCEDLIGKILVANVVLNRVADERFPDSIEAVVFQQSHGKYQFSPVKSGSIYRVTVSKETMEAVERALAGEDYSDGALYFANRKASGSKQMNWFDTKLVRLFAHGNHEFFL